MQSKMGRRSKFLQRHADDMCDLKHGPNEPIYKAETDSHRDQTVIGKGEWGEWTGSAGLADANC